MKNWKQAKEAYIKDHLSKSLKAPNIRLNALKRIDEAHKDHNHKVLEQDNFFKTFTKVVLLDYYLKLRGKPLNSAEKSVIHGLNKFSI